MFTPNYIKCPSCGNEIPAFMVNFALYCKYCEQYFPKAPSEKIKVDTEKIQTLEYYHELLTEESEAMRKEIRERIKHELIMQGVINNLQEKIKESEKEVSNLKEIIRSLSKYVR